MFPVEVAAEAEPRYDQSEEKALHEEVSLQQSAAGIEVASLAAQQHALDESPRRLVQEEITQGAGGEKGTKGNFAAPD
jgi:hypothetical protein